MRRTDKENTEVQGARNWVHPRSWAGSHKEGLEEDTGWREQNLFYSCIPSRYQ